MAQGDAKTNGQIGRSSNLHNKIRGNFVWALVVFCSPFPIYRVEGKKQGLGS